MKSTLHFVNWWFSLAQILLLAFLIGFYTLPLYGIFQLLLMAVSCVNLKSQAPERQKALAMYWIHVFLFFSALWLLTRDAFFPDFEFAKIIFFLIYAGYIAYRCIRYTSAWRTSTVKTTAL
jgi:hypothetical protein